MLLVTFVAIDILSFPFYFYVLGYIYVEKKKAPVWENGTNTPRTLLAMPSVSDSNIYSFTFMEHLLCARYQTVLWR